MRIGSASPVFWAALLICASLSASPVSAGEVTFTALPRIMEMIPRDETNTGELQVAGLVTTVGHDSVRLDVYRGGVFWRHVGARLSYQNGSAPFDLVTRIPAELAEFDIRFYLDDVLEITRPHILCGDVYLINGQSNAQTTGGYTYRSEFIRSFGSSVSSSAVLADTSWGTAQAATLYSHCAVGTWGLEMAKILISAYGVPVALLNGAVGGTSIAEHLRDGADPMNPNTIYGRLLWRATKAGLRHHVKAILWHQGESDTNESNWAGYGARFDSLMTAWQEDLAPTRIYIFQIHQGCGWDYQSQIREIQRTLPEQFDNVDAMATVGVNMHDGCHYAIDGYRQMGRWISRLVARDFYGETDTLDIRPPNVERIWYSGAGRDEIRIRFDNAVTWPADTLDLRLEDYLYLDGIAGSVLAGRRDDGDPRTLILTLAGPSTASRVTYLPNLNDDFGRTYEGPFIRGLRGVGAFSFFEFPITDPAAAPLGETIRGRLSPTIDISPNPFTNHARLRVRLPRADAVRLDLLDASGRVVRVLAKGEMAAGTYVRLLAPEDAEGIHMPAGLYFVRCATASGGTTHMKALRLR